MHLSIHPSMHASINPSIHQYIHPSIDPSIDPSIHQDVLRNWYVPLYNDTYVMLFFGILKKLVSKYLTDDPNKVITLCMCVCVYIYVYILLQQAQSLQNDLLCGQGMS